MDQTVIADRCTSGTGGLGLGFVGAEVVGEDVIGDEYL